VVFDEKKNITRPTRTVSPTPAFTTSYTYDLACNVATMNYPSGRVVSFARDSLGRITGITKQSSESN
jgi:YD repeat-containing protein